MKLLTATLGLVGALGCVIIVQAQQPSAQGPQYTIDKALVLPADFREWTFLSSGLGMTYASPTASNEATPQFSNVFVNPSSYRSFVQNGTWPDKTILILEIRKSVVEGSINKGGHFQSDVSAIEAHVKEAGGWAFYRFGRGDAASATAVPLAGAAVARCVECHGANAAVDQTFVQFYPTLLDIALRKGTIRPAVPTPQ